MIKCFLCDYYFNFLDCSHLLGNMPYFYRGKNRKESLQKGILLIIRTYTERKKFNVYYMDIKKAPCKSTRCY